MEIEDFVAHLPDHLKETDYRPAVGKAVYLYIKNNPKTNSTYLTAEAYVLKEVASEIKHIDKKTNRAESGKKLSSNSKDEDIGTHAASIVADWTKPESGKSRRGKPKTAQATFYWFFRYVPEPFYFGYIACKTWPHDTEIFKRFMFAKYGGLPDDSFKNISSRFEIEKASLDKFYQDVRPKFLKLLQEKNSDHSSAPPVLDRNYPEKFLELFKGDEKINELAEQRRANTGGKPDQEPDGIVSSFLKGRFAGLKLNDEDKDRVRHIFKSKDLHEDLADIFNDNKFEANLNSQEPRESFLKLALKCHSDIMLLGELSSNIKNTLEAYIWKLVDKSLHGDHHEAVGFFFEQISEKQNFSYSTRGIASFIQAKNNMLHGNVNKSDKAIRRSIEYLEKHNALAGYAHNDDLISHVMLERLKNLFSSMRIEDPNLKNQISIMDQALRICTGQAGLNSTHFFEPSNLIEMIQRDKGRSHTLYILSYLYYAQKILKSISEKNQNNAKSYFNAILEINAHSGDTVPRPVCLTLTPLLGLSQFTGLTEISKTLYSWRNGEHKSTSVNKFSKIEETGPFGTEKAIKLLTSYNFLNNNKKIKWADEHASKIMEQIEHNSNNFHKLAFPSAKRYHARFQASLKENRDYLKSELYDAPSHHIFFGKVNDKYVINNDR